MGNKSDDRLIAEISSQLVERTFEAICLRRSGAQVIGKEEYDKLNEVYLRAILVLIGIKDSVRIFNGTLSMISYIHGYYFSGSLATGIELASCLVDFFRVGLPVHHAILQELPDNIWIRNDAPEVLMRLALENCNNTQNAVVIDGSGE